MLHLYMLISSDDVSNKLMRIIADTMPFWSIGPAPDSGRVEYYKYLHKGGVVAYHLSMVKCIDLYYLPFTSWIYVTPTEITRINTGICRTCCPPTRL
jgi:hypothetical protein